jgi:hypothetical protein
MKPKPAFPQPCNDRGASAFVDGGMTLRDYFAAKALQGLASREGAITADGETTGERECLR